MKILICEADKRILQRLSTWIKAMGRRTYTTDCGVEALSIFKSERPNILLVANNIKNMGAVELIKKVREVEPEQAVIVMLEENESPLFKEMIDLEIHSYINKPVEAALLFSVMQDACMQRSCREDLKKQEKLLQNYKDTIEHAFSITRHDRDGKVIDVNENFCKSTKMTFQEVMQGSVNLFTNPRVDTKKVFSALEEDYIYKDKQVFVLNDGKEYLLDITALAQLDENKHISGYLVITNDIALVD